MNRIRFDRMKPHRGPQGFVLVAVLVALVVLTLLAAAIATTTELATREAQASADAFEASVAMTSTRETVLFMLNTQRQTFGGLTVDREVKWMVGQAAVPPPSNGDVDLPPPLPLGNEIKLDGTPYRGLLGTNFALRDDAGRFSPNWTFGFYRPELFNLLEVPAYKWDELEATRLDYQDPDELFRLGGAEREDYARKGLPPPSNQPLATPLELRRIMGWSEAVQQLDDHALTRLFTTTTNAEINVNTASLEGLQTLPGVDKATAERMIARRNGMPFVLLWELREAFKLPVTELDPIRLSGNGKGTLDLWHNAGGPIHQLHWTLTPEDEGGRPWRLDYSLVLPRDSVPETPSRTVASPLFADPGPSGR